MNNDIIRRGCVWITIQGDTDAVLSVASTMAKHFHFDGEAMEIRYGANDIAQLCGIVDGKRTKKYRKHARVAVFDATDYDDD